MSINSHNVPGVRLSQWSILVWFVAMYLFFMAPKVDVQGFGVIDGGVVGVVSLLFLSWTGRVRAIVSAVSPSGLFLLFMLSWLLLGGVVGGDFTTLSHHYYFLVAIVYVLTGVSVGLYWSDQCSLYCLVSVLLKIIVGVATLNSLIIICAYMFPEFKAILEGALYQSAGSNINYAERADRLRGLAAGGAANQSLFLGAAVIIGVALYKRGVLGFIYMAVACLSIMVAIALVGRIGFMVIAIGVVLFLLIESIRSGEFQSKKLIVICFFALAVSMSVPVLVKMFFPSSVYNYSLALFYSGVRGLMEEGTVSIVAAMFHLPGSVRELLLGVGNGSGSFEFETRGDPGYMKMFTAVGLPMALLFYVVVASWSYAVARRSGYFSLFVVLLFVWLVSEIKEPFILKGYFARSMWLFVGVMFAYRAPRKIPRFRQNSSN